MPDGAYYLKIVASDAPANPANSALSVERVSERFEVDNTPPVIERLVASSRPRAANAADVTAIFTARDATSTIERAQYSIDGGDWNLLSPASAISDAPEETYEFIVSGVSSGEHTVAVRAYDRFENVGSTKTTFTISDSRDTNR